MIIKNILELSKNELLELEELDTKLVLKYGNSFSNEIWNSSNFLYQLPKKNDYSFIFFNQNKIIGYIIASEKKCAVYIHRFAIYEKGMSKFFFDKILKKYEKKSIYLMVNIVNTKAISFYEKFNFHIINNDKIIKKFIADNLKTENKEIIIGENYKCYLMKRN